MSAPLGVKTLGELRDRLELLISINTGDAYIDSTPELEDIQEAYKLTAYRYDWPTLLVRSGIAKVANLDRYSLPTTFRKARTVRLDNVTLEETELEFLKRSRQAYSIDRQQNDIILYTVPATASSAFTLQNSPSASNAAAITLDTGTGLSQLEEIWVDSASGTDEFTMVSSISGTALTARLTSAKTAADIIYRQKDIIDLLFYRRVNTLSASGDVTLLPESVDYIMLHAAAAMAFERLEMFDEAGRHWKLWEERLGDAWLASDKNSTGESNSFSVK